MHSLHALLSNHLAFGEQGSQHQLMLAPQRADRARPDAGRVIVVVWKS